MATTNCLADGWTTIRNGSVWLDTNGDTVQAHAPGFLHYGGRWYMIGEDRSDSWHPDVNMYSSDDLVHWRFETKIIRNGVTVPELGTRRFIERAKLMHNPRTGKFVVWCHWEGPRYAASEAACFSADSICGPYRLEWSGRPLGVKSRDCNVFVDNDGEAYFVSTTEENTNIGLFRLADDYLSAESHVCLMPGLRREAPVIVRHDNLYYMLSSACTGGFFLLAKAVNVLGIGTSYAVFTGIGIVGTAIEGVLLLDEGMSALKLISLVLLCGGIIGLKKEEK